MENAEQISGGWRQLIDGYPWFEQPGAYPLPAYSEFMPPPRLGRTPYGDIDEALFSDEDPYGWCIPEIEEEFQLKPGIENVTRQVMAHLVKLGRGEPEYTIAGHERQNLQDNPYWPAELAARAGQLAHERYLAFLPLALSKTQDDKGRVMWTFFGSSEQGPERAFWKGFFTAPERAYLEGVELASVTQGRLGADWSALCAAAVAAAFEPGATAERVITAVLKIAHTNNPELFYQINSYARGGARLRQDTDFAQWWCTVAGVIPPDKEYRWIAPNPIRWALPALSRYANEPVKLMQVLIGVTPGERWLADMIGVHAVPAVIAGSVAGALGGEGIFPADWLAWSAPIAEPWFKLCDVVQARAAEEKVIIREIETLSHRENQEISQLHDKLKGALLAGAIGNAMGSPVECRMFWDIDQQYPGGVQTILDPRRLESEDDNQMAMLLVETYLERDGLPVMARDFGHTWFERLNRDNFFPLCMGHTYDLIRAGQDPRITGHWNVVTGSTVMCMEPVGIYNLADPIWAAQDATAISYMYQRGLDVTAAAMLAATVANALRADATVESVLQAALDVAPRTPLRTFDARPFHSAYDYICTCLDVANKYTDVLSARKELYERCLLYHMIDPLELWGLALAMFKIARGDVRQAAIGGTNIGRDSDTIAGRAAMLSGALKGAGGVPQEWIAMFSPASIERIDRNAARLVELLSVKKLAHLKRRIAATQG